MVFFFAVVSIHCSCLLLTFLHLSLECVFFVMSLKFLFNCINSQLCEETYACMQPSRASEICHAYGQFILQIILTLLF